MVTRRQAQLRLAGAFWLADPDLQALMAVLDGQGRRTRAVGGVVRDTLLAIERGPTDLDLATELVPAEVVQRAEKAGFAAYPTGIEHGTVTIKAGRLLAEVTTLREDIRTDGRHAVVRFGTDWHRDASRRDFTLNALYAELDGQIFDPLSGLSDCLAGRVRFIGDPDQRIAEDRLRVFRFFRFCASHGGQHFDPAGLAACTRAAGTLSLLSAERVGGEMLRMLALPQVAATLAKMHDAGILMLRADMLPALARYEHLAAVPRVEARLALLTFDEETEAVQARWRLSNALVRSMGEIQQAARLCLEQRFKEAAFHFGGSLPDGLAVAGAMADWPKVLLKERLAGIRPVPPFPLRGADLISHGSRPGPSLGAEFRRLQQLWIESNFTLSAEQLIEETRSRLGEDSA